MDISVRDNQLVISEPLKVCQTCGKPMLSRMANRAVVDIAKQHPSIVSQVKFAHYSYEHQESCMACVESNHEYRILCDTCHLKVPIEQIKMRKTTACYDDYQTDHLCKDCAQSGDKVIEFLTEDTCNIGSVELYDGDNWIMWQ